MSKYGERGNKRMFAVSGGFPTGTLMASDLLALPERCESERGSGVGVFNNAFDTEDQGGLLRALRSQ